MIKAVVFDLYGTLMTSQEGPESKDEALSRILLDAGHDVYYQEVWSARQFVAFIDYPRGRTDTPQLYYAKVLERLEIPPDNRLVHTLVREDSRIEKNILYSDVAPTIEALKARGIKTAVVTTIANWRFVPLLEESKVEIDFVCTAREAGAVKPNPKIYSAVLDRFRVRANESMMVGDDPKTDIIPAKALGMKTVLICRDKKVECKEAEHTIASLVDLQGLLQTYKS